MKYLLNYKSTIDSCFSCTRELIYCLEPTNRCVECTSSVLQALIMFRDLDHVYRKEEIGNCIERASRFIEKEQRKDGSWSLKFYYLLYANYSHFYMDSVTRLPMI
jgi:hypothetical protein